MTRDVVRYIRPAYGIATTGLTKAFTPALDAEESEDSFTLHVELPGVKPDEVNVSVEANVLTITGQRGFYGEKDAVDFRRIERRFGRFQRTVRLPEHVESDKVEAAYADGLLTITVPKSESAKPRRIQVAAA